MEHTPSSLLNAFMSQMRADVESMSFGLKGIYTQRGGKSYGGYFYDQLKEDAGGASMTLKMPSALRETLKAERLYTFQGSIEKKSKQTGAVELCFVVASVVREESSEILARSHQEIRGLALAKRDRRFKDVEHILRDLFEQDLKPCIHMIFGTTTVVDRDVTAALGEAVRSYSFTTDHVSMEQPAQLATAIFSQRPDILIAVVRGGGQLDALNDEALARRIDQDSSVCLLTALGHEADTTLLDMVADRSFTTPTDFGNFLAQMAEQAVTRKESENRLHRQYDELSRKLTNSQNAVEKESKRVTDLDTKLKTTRIALLFAGVLILWLFWS